MKDVQASGEAFSLQKRNLLTFFHIFPSWIRIRIVNPDQDTDPGTPLNPDTEPDPQHCLHDRSGLTFWLPSFN
jgi:hypothetical protein